MFPPVVLWLLMRAAAAAGTNPGRLVGWTLATQAAVLLAWAAGSSVMAETPFLG